LTNPTASIYSNVFQWNFILHFSEFYFIFYALFKFTTFSRIFNSKNEIPEKRKTLEQCRAIFQPEAWRGRLGLGVNAAHVMSQARPR
jgi:hypothetical protein